MAKLEPYKVDLVDEHAYNKKIEDNVTLEKSTPSNGWPFPTKESK